MAAGHALTDEDRWPWLRQIAGWITEHTADGRPGIITCSALKRSYRKLLTGPHVQLVFLAGSRELIAARLAARHGHFMPMTLLDSQFATLEPPAPQEHVLSVQITPPPSEQADYIIETLGLRPS
jgi:carbohydrate kinase (thermoresistant glucokinase family)